MPLYQFKCDDCGTFEEWRSLAKSSDPAYCPSCQELSKRIFSPPTILSAPSGTQATQDQHSYGRTPLDD